MLCSVTTNSLFLTQHQKFVFIWCLVRQQEHILLCFCSSSSSFLLAYKVLLKCNFASKTDTTAYARKSHLSFMLFKLLLLVLLRCIILGKITTVPCVNHGWLCVGQITRTTFYGLFQITTTSSQKYVHAQNISWYIAYTKHNKEPVVHTWRPCQKIR